MRYNINFDICAVIIYALLIFFFYYKKNMPNKQNKVFILLLWVCFATTIVDIADAIALSYSPFVPLWFHLITSYIYYILHNATPFLYLTYILILTDNYNRTFTKLSRFLFWGPIVVDGLFIILNPIFQWVFYYDENLNYYHGPGLFVLYFVAGYYLLYGVYFLLRHKGIISKQKEIALNSFVILAIGTVLLQMAFPFLLVELFGISICMLLIYFTIQNPEELLEGMTGLLNRNAFITMTSLSFRNQSNFYILSLRIKDMAFLSRTFGVIYMNQTIKTISKYFVQSQLKIRDIYYIGEGHFALIAKEAEKEKMRQWIKEVVKRFESSWVQNQIELKLDLQMLIIECPKEADSIEAIMDYVDYSFESEETILNVKNLNKKSIKRKTDIEHAIQRAIEMKSFQVYYQPIYSTSERRITSAEALIRLIDEELGFISPEEFISIAEQNGTIIEIGMFVFESVCQFITNSKLKERGIDYIEINLSVVQCMQNNLAESLLEVVQKYNVDTKQINLEITETAAAYSPETLATNMKILSEKGIRFSLDDYGTGYSNMTYMVELPFALAKIDKSIVWSAMDNPKANIAMSSTIAMLKKLNVEIVAEGIENEEQMDNLIQHGCDYLQGYYFSKPVPAEEFLIQISR